MKKGVRLTNIMVFSGAWSTTKIPMILFERSALGMRFANSGLVIDLFGIICIAGMMSVTRSHINLIPFNSFPGSHYKRPELGNIGKFKEVLNTDTRISWRIEQLFLWECVLS
jgi:hypothetical protein